MATRTSIVTVVDEVNCRVGGLLSHHLDHFYEEYGKRPPHFFFDKRYKMGKWDGKLRFFTKTGKTYILLLEEIIPQLQTLGYRVTLNDKRTGVFSKVADIDENYFSHIVDPKTNKPIVFRYYQVEALNALFKEGTGILLASTASGKTFINSCLVDCYGKQNHKTITIVPSTTLVEQTKRTFQLCGLDTGEYSGSNKDINHTHVVSTWQALNRNPDIIQAFTVVVVDECHQAKAAVLKKLLIDYGTHIVHRFGLTGTMPSDATDALTIKCAIGPLRYKIKSKELIERSFLSSVDIEIIQLQENVPNNYFATFLIERKHLQMSEERIQWIADFVYEMSQMYSERCNTLCLVNTVLLGRTLAKLIPNAIFMSRDMNQDDRLVVFNAFGKQENLVVLATVQLLGTGVDISRIFNLVFVDAGKSFVRVIQGIGRGLRLADDKHHIKAFDICSNLKYSEWHMKQRIKFYKQEQFPYKKRNVEYIEQEQHDCI